GDSPQAVGLARGIGEKLKELVGAKDRPGLLHAAISRLERSGAVQPAHTVAGRIEQALAWLDNLNVDDKGLGHHAIKLVTEEGRKIADQCHGPEKYRLNQLCDDIDRLAMQLADLQRRGLGDSPQAKDIADQLRQKLHELRDLMSKALTDRVVEDFADITTPLKQFTDAALAPEGAPDRELNFQDKAQNLEAHSTRCAQTGRMVASGGPCKNKKTVEALCDAANQVSNMTPQIINAGKIRLHHPTSKSADEHFENLRRQFADALQRLRALVDEAINAGDFVKAS
uniref:Vinculin n=1 Tax=Romanomermis culicivorax TaxID=13658 RepID=A0A915KJD2_ROMCU